MNSNNGHIENKIFLSDNWSQKVSSHRQIGGIETSILDNGAGKGNRIAWINTGSGLRVKVVIDRAMDLAEAFFNQFGLSWISNVGITRPNPSVNKGTDWLDSFGGGLLTTCGLTHVGGPEEDKFGKRGLHGRISHIPAELESIRQPDPQRGNLEMELKGKMIQSSVFGPHLVLQRTIKAILGIPKIFIEDKVTNIGNCPTEHMILYHFNFGWPLVDEGAEIKWDGDWKSRDDKYSKKIFNDKNEFKICPSPKDEHRGSGEAVVFIDAAVDSKGICRSAIRNPKIGLEARLSFKKKQLPWLTNWQHWGKNEYVTALEPGTHPPIGQSGARRNKTLINVGVGETLTYNIEFSVNHESSS